MTHHPHAGSRYCMRCAGPLTPRRLENDTRDRLVCDHCGFVHYLNPRPVAGTIPVDDAGRILLLRRDIEPRRGYWVFPGGFMDVGESAEEAAARETQEEAHLGVADLRLLGVYTRVVPGVVVIVFEARPVGTAEVGDETSEIRWFEPTEIPWPDIAFDSTEAALRDLLSQQGHPIPEQPLIAPIRPV